VSDPAALERARAGAGVVRLGRPGLPTEPATSGQDAFPEPTGLVEPTELADLPEHVWYVAYGSNLLHERFHAYLLGGRVAGLDNEYPGGTGTAPASDERAVLLPGALRFGLDAPAWGGGGVAFWDPVPDGPGVLARAWRVRLHQYLEVVHLENGGEERRPAPWPGQVLDHGHALVGDGWYSRLVHVGEIDGEPALTFTHPEPGSLPTRPPSPAYAGVIRAGLVETFGAPGRGGLTPQDAAGYLAEALAS
jgi:hypothetical protein